MKTLKQLAGELGVSKQRVYRYYKNHISDAHQNASPIRLSKSAEKKIREHFEHIQGASGDAHQSALSDVLLKQLEEKDRQIAELLEKLDQSQKLQAIAQEKVLLLEESREKRRWFHRLFRPQKKDP